jgi:hypothetical protein
MSNLTLILMVAIFVIVFAVSYNSLSRMFGANTKLTVAMAICVAVLSVLGLSDMTNTFESREYDSGFSFKINAILLPYILLPLMIMATIISRWIKRALPYFKKRPIKSQQLHNNRDNYYD